MKIFKTLLLLVLMVSCISFEKPLQNDAYKNHAELNYKRIEFDVIRAGVSKKEIGIANISMYKDDLVEDYAIKLYGVVSGEIYFKSAGCGIDASTTFTAPRVFHLSELMSEPKRCTIDVIMVTHPIDDKEHNIYEHGLIKTFVVEGNASPLTMSYDIVNHVDFAPGQEVVKRYEYTGQGSMQRAEGLLLREQMIGFHTQSRSGQFRIVGCNKYEYSGSYNSEFFEVSLRDFYTDRETGRKEWELNRDGSCDFSISIVPTDEPFVYRGRLSINAYRWNVMKLQRPELSYGKDLKVKGLHFVVACIISGGDDNIEDYNVGNKCSVKKFNEGKEYWIRVVTKNGRKHVFSVKNKEVLWSE